jgi:hypothetical protein
VLKYLLYALWSQKMMVFSQGLCNMSVNNLNINGLKWWLKPILEEESFKKKAAKE